MTKTELNSDNRAALENKQILKKVARFVFDFSSNSLEKESECTLEDDFWGVEVFEEKLILSCVSSHQIFSMSLTFENDFKKCDLEVFLGAEHSNEFVSPGFDNSCRLSVPRPLCRDEATIFFAHNEDCIFFCSRPFANTLEIILIVRDMLLVKGKFVKVPYCQRKDVHIYTQVRGEC